MATLDGGRIGIGAQALGIAQGAYESALDYAKERIQFGQPIGIHQGISFKLADMATKLRASRYLIYSAAELKEKHESYSMEAAMAKMYASDAAMEITNDALQIFGGSGFIKGMDVERAYRDAKITTIYEGTNEIQRVVIAAHLLGKIGKADGGASRSSAPKKPAPVTGIRKNQLVSRRKRKRQSTKPSQTPSDMMDTTSPSVLQQIRLLLRQNVLSQLARALGKRNMKLIEDLAKAAGACYRFVPSGR